MTQRLAVVFDVNVLVGAVTHGQCDYESWPSPPPVSGNPCADCLGIANDAREFALFLSSHVLTATAHVLVRDVDGFGWELERAREYVALLVEIARASGGDVLDPPRRVADSEDPEDDRVLDLALATEAALVVSDDRHLLDLSPWRGIPVVTARDFANRTDVMRRAGA